MFAKKILMSVAAVAALGAAIASSPAAAATIVPVGTLTSANPYFYITNGTPFSPSITANFGATIEGPSTAFDDLFQFTIPQNGTGSGSLSTSFSAPSNELTITEVLVNGVSHSLTSGSNGQSLLVGGIPIISDALNTIEVMGTTSTANVAATYTGTATFSATAVPEPAAWAMMIGGLAMVGGTLRRRRTAVATCA
jgi:hypothetical protein